MNFCIILLSVFHYSFNQPPGKFKPDYLRTVAYIYQPLDDATKKDLDKFLGGQSWQALVTGMGRAERDSINKYTIPVSKLRFGGPYTLKQFDSVLTPYHLEIMNAVNRFESRLSNPKLSHQDRIFAFRVLIGLNTALALPLQVTQLPPQDELLKHDIFFLLDRNGSYLKRSLVANMLYNAYKLGIKVEQAKGDDQMINTFMEAGYREAGQQLSGVLNFAFIPSGVHRIGETPVSRTLEPDKDPVYWRYSAMSGFPGGLRNMTKFLNQNLQYPREEWERGIEGTCILTFVVEKDGSLSHIAVEYGVTPNIDIEAVRVMHLSPKWLPGRLNDEGQIVRSDNNIYIDFKIKPGIKREDAFKATPKAVENNKY